MSRSDPEPDEFGRTLLERAATRGFALPDDPDLAAALARLEDDAEPPPEVAEAIAALLAFTWTVEQDVGPAGAGPSLDHPEAPPSPRPGP
ncbi:MAG: hypothetical protein LLP51_04600 [Halorhodospira halophila]|uniref:hypothetical protein n=1 Tax=Halorhodospira TaxID=85108 RepID=UPI0019136841|nr:MULTISPECIES: hypothetical protein [Halorhodospira]MBK5937634.1 hypothetical protein [Halorhodospira halophila]MBK5942435.1 hypothetical protein [Halorhodospira halophila]MCC3750663.1 hypothetical protein [Halorhodospira halophila]MCG5528216.1 hypothetical protein [Halorhodospira halophila]MCG5531985.1 hypothetical protein [Halorhodospira sp. 9621]